MADVVTAAVGGGLGIVSSLVSSKASGKAAETQAGAAKESSALAAETSLQATREAIAAQKEMYEQGRQDLAPWREAGGRALTDLEALMKQGPGEFTKSPGYEFTLSEGTKAIERAASAGGRLASGRTIKESIGYAEGLASTEYDKFLARYYAKLNPYQTMAGLGQTTAATTAQAGTQTGAGIASSLMSGGSTAANAYYQGGIAAGQSRASGYMNQGDIWSNMLSQGAGMAMTYGMADKMGLFKK